MLVARPTSPKTSAMRIMLRYYWFCLPKEAKNVTDIADIDIASKPIIFMCIIYSMTSILSI